MPWAGEVDAILVAGLPGQEGGHAVAPALIGVIEPAGRLVTTFPPRTGRRAPRTAGTPRSFSLGEGLGYSTWDYTEAEFLARAASPTVRVRLTDTGERDSREVVQVYSSPKTDSQSIRLVGWRPPS